MNIYTYLPKYDKCLHFIGGQLVALATVWAGIYWSMGAVSAVAVGKEVWDHYNPPHKEDVWDVVATIVGAFPVWIVKYGILG